MNNSEQQNGILEKTAKRVDMRTKRKPATPSRKDRLADMIGEYVRSKTLEGVETDRIRLPSSTRAVWAHTLRLSESVIQQEFRKLVNRWAGHTGVYNRRSDAEARRALQMSTAEMVRKYRIKPSSVPSIRRQLRHRLEHITD